MAKSDDNILEQLNGYSDEIILYELSQRTVMYGYATSKVLYCLKTHAYYVHLTMPPSDPVAYLFNSSSVKLGKHGMKMLVERRTIDGITYENVVSNIHDGRHRYIGSHSRLGEYLMKYIVPNDWSHPVITNWFCTPFK